MFTIKKFLSLTDKRKHKHAAIVLIQIYEGEEKLLYQYREFEKVLSLPTLCLNKKNLLQRIIFHQSKACISYPNQYSVTKVDTENHVEKIPIHIYLENLRSMHNIGAIIRSCEAFALGNVYLSEQLPTSAMKKIEKTAMGTEKKVSITIVKNIDNLPKPLIAIETMTGAPSCNDFVFPPSGTLLFGNEKYGLLDSTLAVADHFLQIPLFGNKNSINVACAFSIIANAIRKSS